MHPRIGRLAFNIAFFIVFTSAIMLPFLKYDSAEFVVDTLALIIGLAWLLMVVYEVRRETKLDLKIGS